LKCDRDVRRKLWNDMEAIYSQPTCQIYEGFEGFKQYNERHSCTYAEKRETVCRKSDWGFEAARNSTTSANVISE
jgi:hypothetical protein